MILRIGKNESLCTSPYYTSYSSIQNPIMRSDIHSVWLSIKHSVTLNYVICDAIQIPDATKGVGISFQVSDCGIYHVILLGYHATA
jgi:hypothetical protein